MYTSYSAKKIDKRFYVNQMLDIVDNLTGKTYEVSLGNREQICDLLNKESERADRLAEELYDLKVILSKYGIKDAKKLDLVLLEQRVW